MTIDDALCEAERAVRKLYFAIKDEPRPGVPICYEARIRDLADKVQFTAFTAAFRDMCGHEPHTADQVFTDIDSDRPF